MPTNRLTLGTIFQRLPDADVLSQLAERNLDVSGNTWTRRVRLAQAVFPGDLDPSIAPAIPGTSHVASDSAAAAHEAPIVAIATAPASPGASSLALSVATATQTQTTRGPSSRWGVCRGASFFFDSAKTLRSWCQWGGQLPSPTVHVRAARRHRNARAQLSRSRSEPRDPVPWGPDAMSAARVSGHARTLGRRRIPGPAYCCVCPTRPHPDFCQGGPGGALK